MKILSVFGTRPEAIKMAPVVKALAAIDGFESRVCVTAQHREMLDQALELFDISPNFDLDLMKQGQSLPDLTHRVLTGMDHILNEWRPDVMLVHGDTTTTMAATLAGYYAKVPLGHVEAGLRTGDKYAPWPEEINRRITGAVADIHFSPTEKAAENLRKEGIPGDRIHVTGNTVIDALLAVKKMIETDDKLKTTASEHFSYLRPDRKLILVTGHRRENFGEGLEHICDALSALAGRPDVQLVYPVHPNPRVQEPVNRALGEHPNIFLIKPQDYLNFVYLMTRSDIIITDSGGIQEEAPALGKPVLVMRDCTERPEALEAGVARLVGTDKKTIIDETERLLDDQAAYAAMANAENPYGNGDAGLKIAKILENMAGRNGHEDR